MPAGWLGTTPERSRPPIIRESLRLMEGPEGPGGTEEPGEMVETGEPGEMAGMPEFFLQDIFTVKGRAVDAAVPEGPGGTEEPGEMVETGETEDPPMPAGWLGTTTERSRPPTTRGGFQGRPEPAERGGPLEVEGAEGPEGPGEILEQPPNL